MASNIKDMTQGRPARLIFAFALPLMVVLVVALLASMVLPYLTLL